MVVKDYRRGGGNEGSLSKGNVESGRREIEGVGSRVGRALGMAGFGKWEEA